LAFDVCGSCFWKKALQVLLSAARKLNVQKTYSQLVNLYFMNLAFLLNVVMYEVVSADVKVDLTQRK